MMKADIISVMSSEYHGPPDMMGWEGHITSLVTFPKVHKLSLTMRTTFLKPKFKNIK